jgi:hypothetical protein
MYLNAEHTQMTVAPVRNTAFHLNALGLLEWYDPKSVFLGNMFVHEDGTVTVEVFLKHPFIGFKEYTGFDVRGIVMFPKKYEFPASEVSLPGFFPGETALLNPDGYTRRWNPTEFSAGTIPFNYFDGNLIPHGMGAKATSLVNPYRCYYTKADRRYFAAGDTQARHYHLSFAPGPMVFAYAVDVSWGEATIDLDPKGKPTYIPQSFAVTANSIEPYDIKLKALTGELNCSLSVYAGGSANISVQVSDWNGGALVDFPKITVEAPDLFDGVAHPTDGSGDVTTYTYDIPISNTKVMVPGTHPVLFSFEDPETDPYYVPGKKLTAYQVFMLDVVERNPPFCLDLTGIHSVFGGSYPLSGSPGALHMDCSFVPVKVGGAGGLLFDGGIQGGNEWVQVAAIPGAGGPASATTIIQRKGILAGRALVVQTNDYNGHLIVVSDADADNMLIYSAAGQYLTEYDLGPGDDGRNEPVCLAANPSNGDTWLVGNKGSMGIQLERWVYVEQGSAFKYIAHPMATVDLAPWLGDNPRPLGIAINGEKNWLYLFHAKDQGSVEVFDISQYPPVHLDQWSVSHVIGQDIQTTSVSGLRKLIGADILIDHADGEDAARCRILAFANTAVGGSTLVRLDTWCQTLNSTLLGTPFSCMAINNLAGTSNRTLVFFPLVGSTTYVAFLAPESGW